MTEPRPTPNALELLTPPELAAVLGVKVQTLAAWRVSGYGPPAVYVGRWVATAARRGGVDPRPRARVYVRPANRRGPRAGVLMPRPRPQPAPMRARTP
jgi:hypothetical protein